METKAGVPAAAGGMAPGICGIATGGIARPCANSRLHEIGGCRTREQQVLRTAEGGKPGIAGMRTGGCACWPANGAPTATTGTGTVSGSKQKPVEMDLLPGMTIGGRAIAGTCDGTAATGHDGHTQPVSPSANRTRRQLTGTRCRRASRGRLGRLGRKRLRMLR